jgi:spore germination protein GerM
MSAGRSPKHIARTIQAFAGIIILLILGVTNAAAQEETAMRQGTAGNFDQKHRKAVTHLYFADKDNGFLIAEERVFEQTEDPVFYGRQIVEALIRGPAKKLGPTLPDQTTLRALFISEAGTEGGTCYVDLSADIQEYHPKGITTEMLTVYSIVNSLILNISEIKAVKILIEGKESITLAGHVDLQQPLNANMLLIR